MNLQRKKILPCAASLLSALSLMFLSGCGGSDGGAPLVVESGENVTLEGTLQSLGNAIPDSEVTHLLRLEDGTIVYAYSRTYDLDDALYLNQKVEAQGWLIPGAETGEKDSLRIDELLVVEAEELEEEEVTLKPYVSESIGFAILYQTDWTVEEEHNTAIFTAPKSETEDFPSDWFDVSVQSNAQALSVEEWYLAYSMLSPGSSYTLSAIGQDQLPAVKAESPVVEPGATYYYVQGENKIFLIAMRAFGSDYEAKYRRLFAEMLYSFDLLSDGLREDLDVVEEETTTEESEDEAMEENENSDFSDETDDDFLTETHRAVMEAILSTVDSGWQPVHYSFVDPSYVYVELTATSGEAFRRILYLYEEVEGEFAFEELASFEPGEFTDWELVSGENVAKGQPSVEVDAGTTVGIAVPAGYTLMESTSLHFQVAYPSSWYYARLGDLYSFSDEPATETNALVTLRWDAPVVESSREEMSGSTVQVWVPRDETSSFLLSGDVSVIDTVRAMAGTLTPKS